MRNWWWDATWNPVGGCSPVSPGCTNCYAAALAAAYIQYGRTTPDNVVPLHPGVVDLQNGRPHFTGHLTAARPGHPLWTWPLEWPGAPHPKLGDGKPSLIFVGDMSDVFHEGRSEEIIDRVIGTLALADQHIFLLLTKRTARMAAYFTKQSPEELHRWRRNMWLGFSAERQKEFDERWRDMRPLADAGFLIFASVAPMLEPVVLPDTFLALKERAWCVVAGEQGPAALCRDMDPAWARAIRDQCAAHGVAFFMKQLAKRQPIPPDLRRFRQFPAMSRTSRWIINIRGTSGSGKSWVVRQWLQNYPSEPLYGLFGKRKPEAYECAVPGIGHPLFVIGPYETPCGGCDAIQPYGLILDLLRKYAARGHVLFEGLLIGDTYGSVGALLDQLSGEGVTSAVIRLTTPLEQCLQRVQQRRAERGDSRELDPTHTIAHFERSSNSKRRFEAAGSRAMWLDLSAAETNASILRMLTTRDLGRTRYSHLTSPAAPLTVTPPVVRGLDKIKEFGAKLIETQDLDPVYCALYGANLLEPQLSRLLLSYLSFYHLGSAAWLSEREGEDYWRQMLTAAGNDTPSPLGDRWPRASERRHFRGAKCAKAVEWLRDRYGEPEAPMRSLLSCETEKDVIARVGEWPMFGPWAGFKAADLLDRAYGHSLKFDPNIGLLYDEPRGSLETLAAELGDSQRVIYDNLLQHFSTRKAPPRYDRPCGAAEIETVLCKFASMRGRHYKVGKDIREVRHALRGWGPTAERLYKACPAEVASPSR